MIYKLVLKNNWLTLLQDSGIKFEYTYGLIYIKNIISINKYVKSIKHRKNSGFDILYINCTKICHNQIISILPINIVLRFENTETGLDIDLSKIKPVEIDIVKELANKYNIKPERRYSIRLVNEWYNIFDKSIIEAKQYLKSIIKDSKVDFDHDINDDYDILILQSPYSVEAIFRTYKVSRKIMKYIESTVEVLNIKIVMDYIVHKELIKREHNKKLLKNRKQVLCTMTFVTKSINNIYIPEIGNNRALLKKLILKEFRSIDGVSRVYGFINNINKSIVFNIDLTKEVDLTLELTSRNMMDIFSSCRII